MTICLFFMIPDIRSRGESMSNFFWKSSKLDKEFNEPIPRPPSGQERPQNWVLRYVVVKHAFFGFFDVHAHLLNMVSPIVVVYVTKYFLKNNIKSCMFKSVCVPYLEYFSKKSTLKKILP